MEQETIVDFEPLDLRKPVDFPIPNEIIEKVTAYLSIWQLLNLAEVGTERLKKCTFRVLRKKLRGRYKSLEMLKLDYLNKTFHKYL